jgi:hypothetical protein
MSWLPIVSAASLALWLYLLLGRDSSWRARPRFEDETPPPPPSWPRSSRSCRHRAGQATILRYLVVRPVSRAAESDLLSAKFH